MTLTSCSSAWLFILLNPRFQPGSSPAKIRWALKAAINLGKAAKPTPLSIAAQRVFRLRSKTSQKMRRACTVTLTSWSCLLTWSISLKTLSLASGIHLSLFKLMRPCKRSSRRSPPLRWLMWVSRQHSSKSKSRRNSLPCQTLRCMVSASSSLARRVPLRVCSHLIQSQRRDVAL